MEKRARREFKKRKEALYLSGHLKKREKESWLVGLHHEREERKLRVFGFSRAGREFKKSWLAFALWKREKSHKG